MSIKPTSKIDVAAADATRRCCKKWKQIGNEEKGVNRERHDYECNETLYNGDERTGTQHNARQQNDAWYDDVA